MKVFAIHDGTGAISSIVTAPDAGATVRVDTGAGSMMTEVALPKDVKISDDIEKDGKKIAELVEQYSVVVEPRIAKLERQTDASAKAGPTTRRD